MGKIYVALLDKENKDKASAFGVWEDTPKNRETAASWDGYELVDVEFKQAWDGHFYRPGTAPIEPLEQVKQKKKDEINVKRNETEQNGFEYMGKVFDSDQISCLRMTCAAQAMALMPVAEPEPTITWTCKDNSTIDLTVSEMQGLVSSLAAWSNSCHEKATNLKKQIDDAKTNEEVEAIKWD